ncbi:MAG: hypothetical protein ACLP5E_05385 [Streptosporangiaceae bacterium]
MGFHDDLAGVAAEPEMLRLATRRAGSRELAEDALQETVRAITERKSSEVIANLRGFFYVSLIREIDHQLGRPVAIPAENIDMLADRARGGTYHSVASRPASVEDETHVRILAEAVLLRFGRERASRSLMDLVPARSEDPRRYRTAVVLAAKAIFELLLDGCVSAADWNAVLKAAYPQWCDDPQQARSAIDQRLSRARRDVQSLLCAVVSRDQLVS